MVPVEIDGLPINSMVIFHSFLYVYQRVSPGNSTLNQWDSDLMGTILGWGYKLH